MHGGMKVYRGAAAAARAYVEADHSRADDYYLTEGSGLATRYVAGHDGVRQAGQLDGPAYERWVAGYDVETAAAQERTATQIIGWVAEHATTRVPPKRQTTRAETPPSPRSRLSIQAIASPSE